MKDRKHFLSLKFRKRKGPKGFMELNRTIHCFLRSDFTSSHLGGCNLFL